MSTVRTAAVVGLMLWVAGCAAPVEEPMPTSRPADAANPFFSANSLPYDLPPFDRLDDAHYLPAFERGMAEQLEEVEAIANDADAPTVENTLVALERSGRLLDRVATTFFPLIRSDTNDAMDATRTEVAPRLAAHSDQIYLNPALFARVRTLHEQRDSLDLDPEAYRLVEKYDTDFVRAGAELSAAEQARMRTINAELATLETTFAQNVLGEVNASAVVVATWEELAGLPDDQVASSARH